MVLPAKKYQMVTTGPNLPYNAFSAVGRYQVLPTTLRRVLGQIWRKFGHSRLRHSPEDMFMLFLNAPAAANGLLIYDKDRHPCGSLPPPRRRVCPPTSELPQCVDLP